jgi:hypothetical protein
MQLARVIILLLFSMFSIMLYLMLFFDNLLAERDAPVANSDLAGAAPDIARLPLPLATEGTAPGGLSVLFILLAGQAIYTFIANVDTAWPGNQALYLTLIPATERAGIYKVPARVLVPGHALSPFVVKKVTAVRQLESV